jgi:hypothetical protein
MQKWILTATLALSLQGLALTSGLSYDSNVPSDIQKQMEDDISFISQVQGTQATPFHNEIYGVVNGNNYQKFFVSHVSKVGMNDCGSSAAVACVIPMSNPHKIWLTNNFVKFSHPQVARVMVVFHEARHSESENGNWGHDTCPSPFVDEKGNAMKSIWTGEPLAGQPACDSTQYGSYGSSTIMLKNISKYCDNCSDKVKMDADVYAMDQLGRIDDPDVKQKMLNDFRGRFF